MKIAVLKEIRDGETRVAVVPDTIKKLVELGYDVVVQANAGISSGYKDEEYQAAGAKIVKNAKKAYEEAAIVTKIWAPLKEEDKFLTSNMIIIADFQALYNTERIDDFKRIGAKCFALDLMPRISRAQDMDILSSQSSIAGYAAIMQAANEAEMIMPMTMTSAGTIMPVKVLVIGAGVAGLSAVATAKRMGAMVFASDIREETAEQIKSLGGKFVETNDIDETLKKTNILITAANVQGKKAPLLVKKVNWEKMPGGSIIIDMASEKGGNVEGSVDNKTIEENGISITGNSNMAACFPHSASFFYSNNIFSFINLIKEKIDLSDEIIKETLIAGKIEFAEETE